MPRNVIPADIRALLAADPHAADRVRAVLSPASDRPTITDPAGAANIFRPLLAGREDEALCVAGLDRRRRLIKVEILTIGSSGFTVVDPRQIFRWAIGKCARGADAILMAHNHPSGDPTPSQQDNDVTERVARAGRVLGIPLLDHIVIGEGRTYRSYAADGTLPPWSSPGPGWTA